MNRKIFAERGYDLTGKVLSIDKFKPYSYMENGFVFNEEQKARLITVAEKLLDKEYPLLIASDYMMFKRDGNRSIFEGKYFPRRRDVLCLAMAESFERRGRFTDKLVDLVWLLLEETTWVLPAHNPSLPDRVCPLPYSYKDDFDYIDLFSAATGATMSWVYYLAKDILDAVTPIISERIEYEMDRRIIKPFMNPASEPKCWWMGVAGNTVNNWNPWILMNMLNVCAFMVKDDQMREKMTARAMMMLDNFTKIYHDDGGCDEGPGYWSAAGAALFEAAELLYDLTGGYVNIFDDPLVKNMGEYEVKVNVNDNRFLNFADCPARTSPSPALIYRWGKACGSEMMMSYGANKLNGELPPVGVDGNMPYRSMRNMVEIRHEKCEFAAPTKVWLDGIVIAATRESSATDKGLFVAFKGGHNAESHNHNDVGNLVVFADGQPIFLDAGSGSYTRRTFSNERYTIWAMSSDYHNCATVNGVNQRNGGDMRSTDHVYDEKTGGLSMQLKDAYPKEANIASYVRSAVLENGKITVTDELELNGQGAVDFNFICNQLPANVTESSFELHGRTICFDPSLEYSVEELDKTWPEVAGIPRAWDCDVIRRIRLSSKEKFQKKTFVLTIS